MLSSFPRGLSYTVNEIKHCSICLYTLFVALFLTTYVPCLPYKSRKGKGNVTTISEFTYTTPEKVENQLATIKTNALELDNISLKMFKLISNYCINPLTEIINKSLRTGTIPQIWKQSVITPLPKNDRTESFSEIRPINIYQQNLNC